MLSQNLLRNEVYLIENNEITIIYAPLTRYFSIYEGIISYGDIDDDWLVEATSMNNVPDFIKNKGFVFDKDKIRLRLNITSNCQVDENRCKIGFAFRFFSGIFVVWRFRGINYRAG